MSHTAEIHRPHCDARPQTLPALRSDLSPRRDRLILLFRLKWVNGTVLHYCFLEGPERQLNAMRKAFREWKDLGLGLEFTEVSDRSEAEVRIAFDQSDGSWSYVGRDVLGISASEPTLYVGWDLTDDYGHTTALNEIGHTLGMPHEYQNPFAGIVWNEPKVYEYFAGAPTSGPRTRLSTTYCARLMPARWKVPLGILIPLWNIGYRPD